MTNLIFVFGSNLAGLHGAGAAKFAHRNRGAVMGTGVGFAGRSYAIPTKDADIRTMKLPEIEPHIYEFLRFATKNFKSEFQVTRIGCGLAGYTDADIAPYFADAPLNCQFDEKWQPFMNGRDFKYWGSQ